MGREEIAQMVRFERTSGGGVRAAVVPEVRTPTFERISREIEQPAVNARFEWAGSALRLLRDSQDGRGVDLEALAGQLRAHLLSDDRTVALSLTSTRPS